MSEKTQKTILLVEDEVIIALMEKRQLENEGYIVVHALTGENAIEIADKTLEDSGRELDLILMDIDLGSGMDGTVAAQEILKKHDIPVLFLSAHIEKDIVRKTAEISSYGYVVKNSSFTVLDASIIMAFRLYESHKILKEREKERDESERKYRSLFENSPIGIFRTTVQGKPVLINRALAEILGFDSSGEAIAYYTNLGEQLYLHPARRQEFVEQLKKNGEVRDFEFEGKLRDGSFKWLTMNARLSARTGEGNAIEGFTTDITAQKQTLALLAAEKERLAVTLHSIGDGVITTDTAGHIVSLNKVAEILTAWTDEEAAGKPLAEVFHIINEETGIRCENPAEKVLSTGKTVELANHTVLISRDGRHIVLADSGAPIVDPAGAVIGVVLVFRDITAQKRMEQARQKSEARLKRAEFASRSGNWELHLDTKAMFSSEGAACIYGVENDHFDYDVIKNVPLGEYRPLLDAALTALIEHGTPYNVDFKIKAVNSGDIKDIHSTAEYDSEHRILFGVIQDVTRR
jgi:PAS domain S-box-containing protein